MKLKYRFIIFLAVAVFLFSACKLSKKASKWSFSGNYPHVLLLDFPQLKIQYSVPIGNSINSNKLKENFPYKLKHLSRKSLDSIQLNNVDSLQSVMTFYGINSYKSSQIQDFEKNESIKFIIEPIDFTLMEKHRYFSDHYDDGENKVFFDTTFSSFELILRFKINSVNDTILAAPIVRCNFVFEDICDGFWEWSNRNQTWSYVFSFFPADENEIPNFIYNAIFITGKYFRDFFINLEYYQNNSNRSYYTIDDEGNYIEAGSHRFMFELQNQENIE